MCIYMYVYLFVAVFICMCIYMYVYLYVGVFICMLEIQVLGLGQAQKYDEVKLVNGTPILSSYKYKETIKTYIDLFPLKKTACYHKNDLQHKHRQYSSTVNECS